MSFIISPRELSLAELRKIYRQETKISLNRAAWDVVRKSRKVVDDIIEEGQTVYGINTGFGLLAHTSIPDDQLSLLQTNLVLSHSTGVGKPLTDDVVRLIYILKISSLAQGHSGIRAVTIEAFIDFINAGLIADIPEKGSDTKNAGNYIAMWEMEIRAANAPKFIESFQNVISATKNLRTNHILGMGMFQFGRGTATHYICLLYTSDAADE